jgi:hypothetical protein
MSDIENSHYLQKLEDKMHDFQTLHNLECKETLDYPEYFDKHISMGRMDTEAILDIYHSFNGIDDAYSRDNDVILQNKDKFAVEKMDIVVSTSGCNRQPALTTKSWDGHTPITNKHFIETDADLLTHKGDIANMRFAGFALGHAEADGRVGDTAVSILTGGMATVRNGPNAINRGDQIVIGISLPRENEPKKRNRSSHRFNIHDTAKFVIYPLASRLLNMEWDFIQTEVIGKALSSARGWEMVDILVCRQNSDLSCKETIHATIHPLHTESIIVTF